MSSQGPAKAPDPISLDRTMKDEGTRPEALTGTTASWRVWKQVIIGEILNVLERRRYDHTEPR